MGSLLFTNKKIFLKSSFILIYFILIVFFFSWGIYHEAIHGIPRVATFGLGAFFLVAFFLIIETKNMFIAQDLFVKIGNASYTIYLSHLIFISLFYHIGLRDYFTSNQNVFLPLIGLIIIVSFIILFSVFYYYKIEKKLYNRLTKYTSKEGVI
jgi:peptidoglycan/LPS O-acetylase OafA/YrhL